METIDFAVVVLYLAALMIIGLRFGQKYKDIEDLFFSGKTMPWFPVGISVVVSLISGITYIGLPAEVRSHGLGFVLFAFAYVLVIPLVLRVILPFYKRQPVMTAYEFLEGRFGLPVRRFASGMFIVWRLLWMSVVIYVPALILSELINSPLILTILALGLITTIYTAAGGIKAVIWTDLAQFLVMFGGASLVIIFIVLVIPDGIWGVWDIARTTGRTQILNLSFDPTVRVTLWGALIGGFFANLTYFSTDQLIIQRFLTVRSAEDMRRSFTLNCIALTLLLALLSLLGLALFAFYEWKPELLPDSVKPDHVFPFFVAQQFPVGLVGFLIAGVLAATTSSLGAGITAVSTAIYFDFLRTSRSDRFTSAEFGLGQARLLTLAIGLVTTVLACYIQQLGTVMEIAVRLVDGFAGPLLAIFLVGMRPSRVCGSAILIGASLGIILTAYTNFFTSISFLWYPAIGCLSTLLGIYSLNFLFLRSTPTAK